MPTAYTSSCAPLRQFAASRNCGVALVALAVVFTSSPTLADPAPNAPSFSQTSAGALSTPVPDGTCSAITSTRGGGGASSGTTGTNIGGIGGAGALINASFGVLPGQAVTGKVASGGALGTATQFGANNGTGTANGGSSGTSAGTAPSVPTIHRGGGGGGSSSISIAGVKMVEAGGGGGGGGAHQTAPVGNGGGGGFGVIAAGVISPGTNGTNGSDGSATIGGGRGGLVSGGGAGGVNSANATYNGFVGGAIGTGTGGNGGVDTTTDTGGGGGGGYTGGGGGASTVGNPVTGAGGGGGSSFVRATSPTVTATTPTGVTGAAGPATPSGFAAGGTGQVTIDWVPCVYTLVVTKAASATSVNAGQSVRWTVTVRNTGPDPMTKGDIVSLTDTLPSGGGSVFKVVSLSTTTGSTDPNLASGAITCTGVTVGGTMPTTTDCSRPYSAPSAPGAPSGGTRGLNSGETLTIVYDQVFDNAIPAASITNQVSTVDRSAKTGTTDIIGVNATRSATAATSVVPYDLQVTKSTSATLLPAGAVITWEVTVKNLGPGDMFGPDAVVANPLVVSDAAPTANTAAPVSFTSAGPAGSCSYSSGTITCPSSLPLGGTQTFTFQQTINAGTPGGTSIINTASATDYVTGDSNDSSSATVTVQGSADLTIIKSNGVSSVSSGDTVTYTVKVTSTGPDPVTGAVVTDVIGTGLTCPAGNAVSISGSGVPVGTFTISNLTGAGITLGTLNSGQSATFTYSCQVN